MKYIIQKTFALLAFIFISTPFFAQLSMAQKTTKYDKTERPCVEVMLQPGTDEVKDEWKDFVKDNHDVKMKGIGFLANKDVMYAEEVTIKTISPKAINFYTRVVEDGDMTKMQVFGSFGYDVHISENEYPQEWAAMENMVSKFLNTYLPSFYQEMIEETQDQLGDLRDDKKDMEKELSDNKKEIEELTKRNNELNKKLVDTNKKLETTNAKLVTEKQSLDTVKIKLKNMK